MASSRHYWTGGEDYARYRPDYPPELGDFLAQLAPKRGLALDVGCGSGQLAQHLAAYFARVVAGDASQGQVAHAARTAGVEYLVAAAEALPVRTGVADLITSAQAAHWFDLPRFYEEARRVGRPGGVLALVTYGVPRIEGPPGERFDDFYRKELVGYWPPERKHVETGYADLPFPFEELTAPELLMRRSWDLNGALGYLETWSGVRRARATTGEALIDAFRADARSLWGDEGERRRITWPIRMRLGRL